MAPTLSHLRTTQSWRLPSAMWRFALLTGNFSRLLHVIANIGGVPPVAVGAITQLSNGQVSEGSRAAHASGN